MARKRVNKKFAIILTSVIGGTLALGLGSYKLFKPKQTPEKYEALAQQAVEAKQYVDAYRYYQSAAQLTAPPDASKYVKLATYARYATALNRELFGSERAALERALEIDTKNLDALKQLIEFNWEVARSAQPVPENFKRVRDLATRVLEQEPANVRAYNLLRMATVQGWIRDVDTDAADLERCLTELTDSLNKDPNDGEAISVLGTAFIKKATVAAGQGRAKEVESIFANLTTFMDGLVKNNPSNALVLFRASGIYGQLRMADRPRRAEHDRRFAETLAAAKAAVTPEAPLFLDITLATAQDASNRAVQARATGNAAVAKEATAQAADIYKNLLSLKPDNQLLRLSYAEFLASDPATRKEAIELLAKPIDRLGGADASSAFGAQRQSILETQSRLRLQSYRLDAAQDLGRTGGDANERKALIDAARAEITKLEMELSGRPEPLILRGRAEMLQNQYVDAVRTFGLARRSMEERREQGPEYYELLMRLVEAFTESNQTGQAKDVLRTVINAVPNYTRARVMYIQLLARENAPREVIKREYEEARRNTKEEDVQGKQRLAEIERLMTIGERTADGAAAYSSMPESNSPQRIQKGKLAFALKNYDEAVRLFTDVYTENPKDPEIASTLVAALALSGRTDQARQVLAKAREDMPDEVRLKIADIELGSGTPEEKRLAKEKLLLDSEKDDLTREKKRYEIAIANRDAVTAREALTKAQSINPNDPWVMDIAFQTAIAENRLADADKLIAILGDPKNNYDRANGALYRFKLQTAKKQYNEALATAKQLIRDLPEFAQAWLVLGQAQLALGDYEQALAGYQQALNRQSNNPDAYEGAIRCNYELRKSDEALRLLNDALARFPNDGRFREFRLNHELIYGNADEAIRVREQQFAELKKITDGKLGEQSAREAMLRGYLELANAYARVATSKQTKGDNAGARGMWGKSATAFAGALDLSDRADGQIVLLAQIAKAGGSSDKPLEFEPVLRKFADSPALANDSSAQLILGEFYSSIGKLDEAEKAVREAVRRGGGAAEPRRAAARLLTATGKVDDAVSMLDGIDNAKANRDVQLQRAEILLGARRFDQAEKVVRALLAQSPNDIDLQNLLTIVFVNNGIDAARVNDPQKSAAAFKEAQLQIANVLRQDPRNYTAIYYRGLINLRAPGGDVRTAIQDLQLVRDNGNLNPEMRMMLVEAYRRAGENDNATREIREVLKREPTAVVPRLQLVDWLASPPTPRLDEALKVVDEGLAMPELANNPSLWLTKMRILVNKKDFEKAVVAGQKGVQFSNSAPAAVQAYLETLVAAKKFTDVLRETDPLVQRPEAKPSWLYVVRGAARMGLNDREGAINEFVAALGAALDDDSTNRAAVAMAEYVGADEAIKAMEPRLDQALRWRLMTALLHQTKGRSLQAMDVLNPALARVDSFTQIEQVQLLRTAGLFLVSPGPQLNYEKAIEIYRKLLRIYPDDIPTLNNLAYVLSEKVATPNLEEALTHSSRAVEILRRNGNIDPAVFDTHGWVLVLAGRVSEGINILNEALSRRSFVEGHYHLGSAYLRANLVIEGIEQLRKAQSMASSPGADPSYKEKIEAELKRADEMRKRQDANR